MSYTVVGARGFIGGAFASALRARGAHVVEMTHEEAVRSSEDLGDVIYASGVAWDAERRVAEAVRTHIDVPLVLVGKCLHSFTYISSTRVYGDSVDTRETVPARVARGDVYAATKAAGETLVLADPRPSLRVVRLSNVYGPSYRSGLMLSDFLRQAATQGEIVVRSAADSEKDHVSIDDVVDATLEIAARGRERVYNIAAGRNTRQGALLDAIAQLSGGRVTFERNAPTVRFAPIATSRLRDEFGFAPRNVLDDVPALWGAFAAHFAASAGAVR